MDESDGERRNNDHETASEKAFLQDEVTGVCVFVESNESLFSFNFFFARLNCLVSRLEAETMINVVSFIGTRSNAGRQG